MSISSDIYLSGILNQINIFQKTCYNINLVSWLDSHWPQHHPCPRIDWRPSSEPVLRRASQTPPGQPWSRHPHHHHQPQHLRWPAIKNLKMVGAKSYGNIDLGFNWCCKLHIIVIQWFFLNMDMSQNEVSVYSSRLFYLRGKRTPHFETSPHVAIPSSQSGLCQALPFFQFFLGLPQIGIGKFKLKNAWDNKFMSVDDFNPPKMQHSIIPHSMMLFSRFSTSPLETHSATLDVAAFSHLLQMGNPNA